MPGNFVSKDPYPISNICIMPSALCPHLARVWRQPCISEVRWGMFNCESVTCPAGCWRLVRDCGPRPADQLISRHSVLAQLKVRRTKPQVTPPPSADDSPVPEQSVAQQYWTLNLSVLVSSILLFSMNLQNLPPAFVRSVCANMIVLIAQHSHWLP